MADCVHRLNINGVYKEFNSDEELNSFIRQNRRLIESSLLTDKIMFSLDKTKQQNIFNELGAKSSEIDFREPTHQFFVGQKEYMPVTKFMYSQEAKNKLGYKMIQGFNIQDWEKNTRADLESKTDENGNALYTPAQIAEQIAKVKDSWQVSSLLGTSWHKLAELYIDGKIQSVEDITANLPQMEKVPPFIKQKYLNILQKFKETLALKHPDSLYLTEVNISDPETGVAGIVDLVVVDPNGKIHLYDYKTSTKNENDWNKNKNESNRYQLAFYRQILRRQGYDVDSTYILPVNIKEVDYTDNVIYDFDIGNPSSRTFVETEPLMQNVKTLMPFSFGNKLNEIQENTPVHQFIKEAFNYEQKKTVKGSKSVDDEYARLMSRPQREGAKFYWYRPFNNNNQSYSFPKTLDEATIKSRIAQILQDIDETNSKLPNRISELVSSVKEFINSGGTFDTYSWAKWSEKDTGTNIKIKELLFKYINDPSWSVVNSDSLADLNMLSFENVKTNEVDFIALSTESLENAPELLVGKTILGNFDKDQVANTLGIYKKATNGDVELLKTYAFIKQNRGLFIDKKIGSIFAVNLLEGNRIPHIKTQAIPVLEKWHQELVKRMPDQLGIKANTWTPSLIDKGKAFLDYMNDLVDSAAWRDKTTYSKGISDATKRYANLNSADIEEKTKLLGEVVANLTNAIDSKFDTISSSDRRDTGLALKLATEAILQLNNIPTIVEEDLKRWNHILDENMNTTDANMFKENFMKQLTKVVTLALNNARTYYLNDIDKENGIREMHADLYKNKGSILQIKGLGYNQNMFHNLIEKDDAGKPLMRFVDPKTAKISPAEKQYIEHYLKMINDVRVEKLRAKGKDDEWIQNFLDSADARNIPLMKAGALTSFLGKDIKTFANSFFRDVLNPNNIFKEDQASLDKIKMQKEMFNPFDIYDVNLQNREDRIDNSAKGDLETDLELVLGTYMMAHAKEVEYTKQLPIINAIKTAAMLDHVFNFNTKTNTNELISDYIGTTIMGKTILGGESEKLAKATKVGQELTSFFVLGLSPFAGMTEMVTGFFGNVSRLLTSKYSYHPFSAADYAKAHAVVGGTLSQNAFSYDLVSFCDGLNEMYGISDMDIKQMVHELQTGANGLSNFKSKYAYWFNTFPGYFNRMVLFVAASIGDGVLDVDASGHISKNSAYQMIDGKLVYNEKLDKRFSLYTNNKTMPDNKQTEEWKKQRSLYEAIKENLAKSPNGLKADGTLNKPYDNNQRNSLKEFADDVHGSYDTENKTNLQKMAFGRIFMQFKGWIRSKKNRYYADTQLNDTRGRYEYETLEDGRQVAVWKGRVTEGIFQTMMATYNGLQQFRGNPVKTWEGLNDTQKENWMYLLGDTFIFGLLTLIASLLTEPNMQKTNPAGYQAVRSLTNSSHDFFIPYTVGSVSGTKNPVALLSWGSKVAQDSWSVVTGGKDPSTLLKNVAVYRTLNNISNTVSPPPTAP